MYRHEHVVTAPANGVVALWASGAADDDSGLVSPP